MSWDKNMKKSRFWLNFTLSLMLAFTLAGCSKSPQKQTDGTQASTSGVTKVFNVCPGESAQKEALIAFFDAREGDTIRFCAGHFEFDAGLVMTGNRGITIEGAGIDKTVLSFKNSPAQDGISINNVDGITVQNLTLYDAPGNGLRIFRSKHVTLRKIKVGWSSADPKSPNFINDPNVWKKNGAYAIYPVLSQHILIEDSIAFGSSDAGLYIGQSSDILARRNEAFHNVAGFEFENTYRAEFADNLAHDNTAGFYIFDLPVRAQFGEKNKIHRNKAYSNNVPNFGFGILGQSPSGLGIVVHSIDQVELVENDIKNNKTAGLLIMNYGLFDPNEPTTNYDFFPEGIRVANNKFTDNGYDPQKVDLSRSTCRGPLGLPALGQDVTCLGENASLLVAIVQLKNAGRSGHILWDGAEDAPGLNGACDTMPVDRDGIPLNKPNPKETTRPEPRLDERGRPNYYQFDPMPVCKYNAWKFKADGTLKRPQNGICVESNKFVNSNLNGLLVNDFVRFNFKNSDITDPSNFMPVSTARPMDCPTVDPKLLPEFTPRLGGFVPNPSNDPRPSEKTIAAVCSKGEPGKINYPALLNYNCPRLENYGLFKDAEEPRKNASGFGIPYDLNTPLFSDYSSKYRFLYLPPDESGRPQKATYQDHKKCETLNIFDCLTATLHFPVGTVLAKTFTFKDGSNEEIVETRLLIKRKLSNGTIRWVGMAYEWLKSADGSRHAVLRIEGASRKTTYNYDDIDPAAVDAKGKRLHYQGTVEKYEIPNAGACILCHNGDDLEAGAPPIGPKVRNLNRNYAYPDASGTMNQLAYMQMKGLLDLPGDPNTLERMPRFNVPGSTGETPNSAADIHKRARAFLEVNCMHCHNVAGNAQNSGLRLDSFAEPMGANHGICKPPIAAGKAAEIGPYDIQPGDSTKSILVGRVASTEPGKRMPPVGRTVLQVEALDLLTQWVNNSVATYADPAANHCGSGGGAMFPTLPFSFPSTTSAKKSNN